MTFLENLLFLIFLENQMNLRNTLLQKMLEKELLVNSSIYLKNLKINILMETIMKTLITLMAIFHILIYSQVSQNTLKYQKISLKSQEISLKYQEISLMYQEISLKSQEISLVYQEISLKSQEISLDSQEISLDSQEISLTYQNINLYFQ